MLVYGFEAAPNLHYRYTMPSVRSALRGVVRLVCLNNCLSNLATPFQFFRNDHLFGKQIALIDYSRLRRRNIDNNVPDSLTNSRAKRSVWTVANSDL